MRSSLTLLAALGVSLATARGSTIALITNGDFETGNLSGWSASTGPAFGNTAGSCNNGFAAQSMGAGCVPGTNPSFGTYAAYSAAFPAIASNVGEWDNYLDQTFVVPNTPISSAVLTWDDASNWSGTGTFRGVDLAPSCCRESATSTSTTR